jgi:hypothetical protein
LKLHFQNGTRSKQGFLFQPYPVFDRKRRTVNILEAGVRVPVFMYLEAYYNRIHSAFDYAAPDGFNAEEAV